MVKPLQFFRKLTSILMLLFLGVSSLYSQSTISGTVKDEKGNSLFNATIVIKETYLGVLSDLDGKFKMNDIPNGTYTIYASFIGYYPVEQIITLKDDSIFLELELENAVYTASEVVVEATRADEEQPITFQNVSSEEIEKNNVGVDLPIILDQATSVVTTSDAGAGVGYTGLRIRGSDATRINVSINGVPLNDSESQGVFWVNMPDFASSVNDVQIQRGVGTSTNGAGAFGATVNLSTNRLNIDPYGSYSGSYGSFQTVKNSVEFGSGLINNRFVIDGRLSTITSDGFIDRSASDLRSYYLSGAMYEGKNTLKFLTFGGKERTYQAWNGVPVAKLNTGDRTFNPYDYENQVDNYNQTHYQLHFSREVNRQLKFSVSGHYTKGEGYFEEYKGTNFNKTLGGSLEKLSDYGLNPVVTPNDTIHETSLIRRRWLDNDFYGAIYSLNYQTNDVDLVFGGGFNRYEGDHFGEIIWAEVAASSFPTDRYYENVGDKNDFNTFLKGTYKVNEKFSLFGDLQYRSVSYKVSGVDNDQRRLSVDDELSFFNPKGGAVYRYNSKNTFYFSAAVANREPSRGDYVDAIAGIQPKSERLIDYELGYKRKSLRYQFNANLYFMNYKDQLVLTGEVNDVGGAIRTNVDKSYRRGIELEFSYLVTRRFEWGFNTTLSQNKIDSFDDKVDNWLTGEQSVYKMEDKDIAFSPNVIFGSRFQYSFSPKLLKVKEDEMSIAFITKYVGEQFLDNTENESRKLDAYVVSDLRLSYSMKNIGVKQLSVFFTLKNVFDELYSANGWVYKFEYGANDWDPSADDLYTEKVSDGSYQMVGLFPQAGTHFFLGLSLQF